MPCAEPDRAPPPPSHSTTIRPTDTTLRFNSSNGHCPSRPHASYAGEPDWCATSVSTPPRLAPVQAQVPWRLLPSRGRGVLSCRFRKCSPRKHKRTHAQIKHHDRVRQAIRWRISTPAILTSQNSWPLKMKQRSVFPSQTFSPRAAQLLLQFPARPHLLYDSRNLAELEVGHGV